MRPFLIITIISALVIAGTAALFSVTGISSVFAGHFIQVAIMAGALETGKIVISSILYRYWGIMNKAIKSYMVTALFVLMIITSVGIFGYLSEAYQKTKSGYEVVDKEIQLLQSKKQLFQNEYDRYQNRLNDLTGIRIGQETRLDSLYSRGQVSSAKRIETNIKRQDDEITQLNSQILAVSDSLSSIDKKIIEKQSVIITGDLGPIKYVADVFGTDMDTIVKWLILVLIFVFDPLAVTLIVAANMIFINKHYEREEWTGLFNKNKNIEKNIEETANEYLQKEEANALFPDVYLHNAIYPETSSSDKKDKMVIDNEVPIVDDNSRPPEVKKDEPVSDITQSVTTEETTKSMSDPEDIQHKEKPSLIELPPRSWKSANWIDPK